LCKQRSGFSCVTPCSSMFHCCNLLLGHYRQHFQLLILQLSTSNFQPPTFNPLTPPSLLNVLHSIYTPSPSTHKASQHPTHPANSHCIQLHNTKNHNTHNLVVKGGTFIEYCYITRNRMQNQKIKSYFPIMNN
jgi:hypothetical protein